MSIATETETLEQEVNRRVSQFIADNPRFTTEKDFLVLQTVALIGVSATLTAFANYGDRVTDTELRNLDEEAASRPLGEG